MKKVILLSLLVLPQFAFACGPANTFDSYVISTAVFALLFVCFIFFAISFKRGKVTEERFLRITKLTLVSFVSFALGYYVSLSLDTSLCMPMDRDVFIGKYFGIFFSIVLFVSCVGLLFVSKIKQASVHKSKYIKILTVSIAVLLVISVVYFYFASLKNPHLLHVEGMKAPPVFVVPTTTM